MSDYNGSTVPDIGDNDNTLLKKIAASVGGGGGSGEEGGGSSGLAGILAAYEKTPQGPLFVITAPTGGDPFVELANRPDKTSGFRFELEPSAAVEFGVGVTGIDPDTGDIGETIARSTTGDDGAFYDEPISVGENFYIVAVTGVVKGRWCQR